MAHSFLALIDESGDDGIGKFREPHQKRGGTSKWLIISACVLRASNSLETVKWRDEIVGLMPDKKSRVLHFAHLNHGQRLAAVKCLSTKPIRLINVLTNKTVLLSETYKERNKLYFHLTRFLIERISWVCRDMRPSVPESDGRVKIVFSRRGGLSYDNFKEYIELLKESSNSDVRIHWPVIDVPGIEATDHSRSASLQLVDIAASSFAAAFEQDPYGNCILDYARLLKRHVYHREDNFLSYGMKFHPRHTDLELTNEQMEAVRLFERR